MSSEAEQNDGPTASTVMENEATDGEVHRLDHFIRNPAVPLRKSPASLRR